MRRMVAQLGAVLFFLGAGVLAGPLTEGGTLRAQSVAEVVEGMYAAVERQAATVTNYTLSEQVMGVDTYSYFEKELVDGHPVFRLKMSDGSGFSFGLGGEDVGLGDVFIYGPKFLEHGVYAGTEKIGNFTVHVLSVEGDAAAEIVPPRGPGQVEYRPHAVRLYVDAQMMVPRRILLEGDAMTDTGPQSLDIQLDMQNILPIETMLVPFKTTLLIAGMSVDVTLTEILINAGRPTA
ncbi:MAG: hypothetical protein AB7T31_01220 [Gemmatimonadales bacterium]